MSRTLLIVREDDLAEATREVFRDEAAAVAEAKDRALSDTDGRAYAVVEVVARARVRKTVDVEVER